MQGRLSPPVAGRIQSFPGGLWREEFALAKLAGLDCIEWVYEAETEKTNPLFSLDGLAKVRSLAQSSGVAVSSICADYYMLGKLVGDEGAPCEASVEHLANLLDRSARLGIKYIVLPFVDSSSLKSTREITGLARVLHSIIPVAEQVGVELHLETDLNPILLRELLSSVSHPMVKANYDIGNSASLGWDPKEELTLIGPFLGSVHVKDRLRHGHTVQLGEGAADFRTCFRQLQRIDFRGPLILQAARREGISELDLAVNNKRFVQEQWAMSMEGN